MKEKPMSNKQPTATAFTRTQQSWAEFVLVKVRAKIAEQESWLREQGWPSDKFNENEKLMDMYDDELFYLRYAEEMEKQRAFIRKNYLGEDN